MKSPPPEPPSEREPIDNLTDASPVVWDKNGAPRSHQFDDVYFSKADGLAESRAVFLTGCGLPDAWRGRGRFVVGELGFGTGLNVLALLDLWRGAREPGARLHIFSVEAFPLTAAEARRALSAWPDLADLAEPLLAQWPRRARGFHRLDFADLNATLDLAVMDASEALTAWSGRADAWFLDGFAPSRNPDMWTEALLKTLAARSAPGARAATFTVAGAVRRGLEANGFSIEKKPGFGHKRERLEARLSGTARATEPDLTPPDGTPPDWAPRIAIVGAGIAGAALARAFAALGAATLVIEAQASGAGASGNGAALVMPRLDAGGGAVAQLFAQAFARASDLYAALPDAVIATGAVQLEAAPKDPSRFDRIAGSGLFEAEAVRRLAPGEASERLGEATTAGGLAFAEALVVEPAMVLSAWLARAQTLSARVAGLERDADGWRLLDQDGGEIARADEVCLTIGADTASLAPDANISPVRGQVSVGVWADAPPAAIWGGYVIPTRNGVLFGATHDRGQTSTAVTAEDHRRNLDQLAEARPALAAAIDPNALAGRAGLRAVTPDFLPIAGAAESAPGLYLLSGLGSRGFCAAPLLAEHLAALVLGAPSPLPRGLAALVDPARFSLRRNRRLGRLIVK
jgi:tRNA 5-methylaminomethyl-2-thiouridine biosynthesis bifunctional protein